MFDTTDRTPPPGGFGDQLDELRCHTTSWLRGERERLQREQRRLHVREMAVTRVLDEREALDTMPDATVSARTARATVEVARRLESLPVIAAAAEAGDLSFDQLQPLTELADTASDREWAERARRLSPADLQRMAQRQRPVSAADAAARMAARHVRTWREPHIGMASGRWSLPDVDGVLVDKVLDHMAERMRPPAGEPWDSLAHRKADALVELCRSYADVEPTGRFKYLVVIQRRDEPDAVPEVDGIPIAAETLDAILPNAAVHETTVDARGERVRSTKRRPIPAAVERHVRLRDRSCRVPGCETNRRLQLHHLVACCHGGGDKFGPRDLAAVCPYHHRFLEPHGPWRLVGDPEEPDGLRLVHRDERLADARAGPAP